MPREATIHRTTSETSIQLSINLDGSGISRISTGIAFFDHMLTLFSKHGLMDLDVTAKGDIEVDFHHTVEDTGIALGQAITQALGDKAGSLPSSSGSMARITDEDQRRFRTSMSAVPEASPYSMNLSPVSQKLR